MGMSGAPIVAHIRAAPGGKAKISEGQLVSLSETSQFGELEVIIAKSSRRGVDGHLLPIFQDLCYYKPLLCKSIIR